MHATYRMTTKLRYDPGVVVFPYRGGLESGDHLWHAVDSSNCKVVDRAQGICDFEERLYIDPRGAKAFTTRAPRTTPFAGALNGVCAPPAGRISPYGPAWAPLPSRAIFRDRP
ncbi:hypothetical protein [Streptomyces sp. NPDC085937]|uniref:hypothetical protein n=1 Tax=Streptomyces sp. NPDC085937 TaxID=3365742 RepID=UPI0037D849EB